MTTSNLPCLALAGPTASGKTAAALALAERLAPRHPVEIISVDSALVYRGMDIGTAKPSRAELARAPHHLIDIRDPLQAYSAAEFAHDAGALVQAIRARGALPLLVGGTMLYFKALMEGLDPMPPAHPEVRAALEAEATERGWPALHADLARLDPITAQRLAPNDAQRIQRALEVYRVSGQTLSSFHAAQQGVKTGALPIELISLEPLERQSLHHRIEQRFDAMLQQGFIDEVCRLRARGDLHPDLPSMRCVGYRQAWEALSGVTPMSELRDRGIFATRQLAKRQLTWLRSMPQRHTVACDARDAQDQVLALAETLLRNSGQLD
ncbi:MAG: tRNA (adenosine(37)-N6)-dimethylallyltransferase MiaA [Curvibacter sp.]|nr:MAG: tRNA (adenosine(37)-N6)-dimethylallyltransferase MiaA [Curvibacter sp.]